MKHVCIVKMQNKKSTPNEQEILLSTIQSEGLLLVKVLTMACLHPNMTVSRWGVPVPVVHTPLLSNLEEWHATSLLYIQCTSTLVVGREDSLYTNLHRTNVSPFY